MDSMQGQWIVVDADKGSRSMTLLQVGSEHFDGVSVRKNLSRAARALLLHPLEQAVMNGKGTQAVQALDGSDWSIVVEPILSPLTKKPVGALGVFVPADDPTPQRPLVGGLEWRLTREGREAFWDNNVAEIYQIRDTDIEFREDGDRIVFPSSHWLATFVSTEDQHKLQRVIDEATNAETTRRARISYQIEHPRTGTIKMLEFSAQNRTDSDGTMYFFGMTREVPHSTGFDVPDDLTVPQPEVDAIAELTADIPMAQLKVSTSELVQILPGWRRTGLSDARHLRFLDMVQAEQRDDVRALLETRSETIRAMPSVPLRHVNGQWRTYTILVKDLAEDYVMLRLNR